jgi:predicted ester cyclase
MCVAVVLTFVLAWAPALAQETGPLPQVDWPSESRFVSTMAPSEQGGQLLVVEWPCESRFTDRYTLAFTGQDGMHDFAWPCESRFAAMSPAVITEISDLATGETITAELAVVAWPCEARFVAGMVHEIDMAGLDWPCEARFVALVPVAVPDGAASLAQVDWPSEARLDPLLAFAPRISPASQQLAMAQLDANKLLHRAAVQSYFDSGATDDLFQTYPEELALAHVAEWRSWQNAFDDLEVTLDFQVAEGNRVVSCWTVSGIQSGEFMGAEPADDARSFQVLYAAQFEDGQIVGEMGQLNLEMIFENLDVEEGQHTS